MSENVSGQNLFASGGHRWVWGEQEHRAKEFSTVAVAGAGSMLLNNGPRPGVIAGLLKGNGASRVAADKALSGLEAAIETLCRTGLAYSWEDDHGHRGDHLVLRAFTREEPREYGIVGAAWNAWQRYRIQVRELDGKP
jgi:hypothetical protein